MCCKKDLGISETAGDSHGLCSRECWENWQNEQYEQRIIDSYRVEVRDRLGVDTLMD